MLYDLHGSWDTTTGINSPLYAGPKDVSAYQKELNVNASVNYWLGKGCPKEKFIMGVPLYGRSFTLSNPQNFGVGASVTGAGRQGLFIAESGFLPYYEICYQINRNSFTRVWENTQLSPYAFGGDQWVGYDDLQSLLAKLDYIKYKDLGGAMFWSIDTDDFNNICGKGKFPLISAAYNALNSQGSSSTTSTSTSTTKATTTTRSSAITTTTKSSATTTSSSGSICVNGDGLYKDPTDCTKFYKCANGQSFRQSCPSGLVFNPLAKVCDWSDNVKC